MADSVQIDRLRRMMHSQQQVFAMIEKQREEMLVSIAVTKAAIEAEERR